jgi:GT2 family glycosyltransferase
VIARVVVVNFNGGAMVGDCVASVLASRFDGDMQVVVVDNASTDGSADAVVQRFGDRVHLLRNPTNQGFVAANAAMGRVPGLVDPDVVALVNPDATVADDWLALLAGALHDDPGLGAVSPCMLFAHRFVNVEVHAPAEPGRDPRELAVRLVGLRTGGTNQLARLHPAAGVHDPEADTAGLFRWLAPDATIGVPVDAAATPPFAVELDLAAPTPKTVHVAGTAVEVGPRPTTHTVVVDAAAHDLVANAGSLVFDDGTGADRGHFCPLGPPFDAPSELFAWCGGGVLLRRGYLDDVGLFDEGMFLYYEDTDLSWRGRSRGWRYRYVPGAVMRHVQGASGGSSSDVFVVTTTRNRLLMVIRNASAPVVRAAVADVAGQLWASLRFEVLTPVVHLRRPQWRMLALRCRAVAQVLAGVPRAVADRRRLRAAATVPAAGVEAGLVRRGSVAGRSGVEG